MRTKALVLVLALVGCVGIGNRCSAQLPEMTAEEAYVLRTLLTVNSDVRVLFCRQIANEQPVRLMAHLCYRATMERYREACLESLQALSPSFGDAVKVLLEGGKPDTRLAALLALRDMGYVGTFAFPAVQVEAQRGEEQIARLNETNWRDFSAAEDDELNCYKCALWMLGRCTPTAEMRTYLLSQLDIELKVDDAQRRAAIESLLFMSRDKSSIERGSVNEWDAGVFSALCMFCGADRELRVEVADCLAKKIPLWPSVRQAQAMRTLTTCGSAAKVALPPISKLINETQDERVRAVAIDVVKAIEGRMKAAELAGNGSDFELLLQMLSNTQSPFEKLEAQELLSQYHAPFYRLADALYMTNVTKSHYTQCKAYLTPDLADSLDQEKLETLLHLSTAFLLGYTALIVDASDDPFQKRRQYAESIISKMELTEHLLNLLARRSRNESQYRAVVSAIDGLENDLSEQNAVKQRAIVDLVKEHEVESLQSIFLKLLLCKHCAAMTKYTLEFEEHGSSLEAKRQLQCLKAHLQCIALCQKEFLSKAEAMSSYLFIFTTLLYFGGDGNGGIRFEKELVDAYISLFKEAGEHAREQAARHKERLLSLPTGANKEAAQQVNLYIREVLDRIQ